MAIRMQQRRGTASQWTTANTVLAAGEIGFETDTNKFKIGDGTTSWSSLQYFNDIQDLSDTYVALTQKGAANGVATLGSDGKLTSGQLPTVDELAQDAVNSALTAGTGISKDYNDAANTITIAVDSTIATKTYADSAVSTHSSDTTSVHGIADTSALVLTDDARLTNVRTPSDLSVTTGKIADSAVTSAKIADGTIVAGDIADGAITSAKILDGTIVNADINASAAIAQSKIANLTTDLAAKAPLAGPTFTGTVNATDLTLSGNLTVNGTTTTVSSANLELTDSLIYLASTQYDTDAVDIGIYGAYGDANPGHLHTGLVRDASDGGKWKLISGGAEPTSNVVDFTGVIKDTLVIGALEATSATIGNVSDTELQYLDGVTSAIQTQINNKAPLASPTFTGTVTLPSGTVTSTMIADGTIVNADINATAAIDKTKISGTAITAADSGTVTNAMLAGSIAASKISGTAITAGDTGTVTNTMLAGSIANAKLTNSSVTIGSTNVALGTTAATVTGLTLTSPTIDTPTLSLATSSSTAEGRISWDSTYHHGYVGNGAAATLLPTFTVNPTAKTGAYILTASDANTLLQMNAAAAFTVPLNSSVAYPVGTQIHLIALTTGVSVAFTGGVSYYATPGLKLRAGGSMATLIKLNTDIWALSGDLIA